MTKVFFLARYGMIVGMGIGPFKSVALYDFLTMKEAFNREEFQGRAESFIMKYRTGGKNRGLVMTEGPDHKLHRKFMLRTMKDLGAGKSKIEHILMEEADRMSEYLLDDVAGKPFEVNNFYNIIALNMVWNMVAGKRYYVAYACFSLHIYELAGLKLETQSLTCCLHHFLMHLVVTTSVSFWLFHGFDTFFQKEVAGTCGSW